MGIKYILRWKGCLVIYVNSYWDISLKITKVPKSIGFNIWRLWTSVQNVMTVHVVEKKFQSASKWLIVIWLSSLETSIAELTVNIKSVRSKETLEKYGLKCSVALQTKWDELMRKERRSGATNPSNICLFSLFWLYMVDLDKNHRIVKSSLKVKTSHCN